MDFTSDPTRADFTAFFTGSSDTAFAGYGLGIGKILTVTGHTASVFGVSTLQVGVSANFGRRLRWVPPPDMGSAASFVGGP